MIPSKRPGTEADIMTKQQVGWSLPTPHRGLSFFSHVMTSCPKIKCAKMPDEFKGERQTRSAAR